MMFLGDLGVDLFDADSAGGDEVPDFDADFAPVGFDRHWPITQDFDHRDLHRGQADLASAGGAGTETHTRNRGWNTAGHGDFWPTCDLCCQAEPSGGLNSARASSCSGDGEGDVL